MKNLYTALKAIVDTTLGGGKVKRKPEPDGYYIEPIHKDEMEAAQKALAEFKAYAEPDWLTVEPGTLIKVKDYDGEPWAVRMFDHYSDVVITRTADNKPLTVVAWNKAEFFTPTELALVEAHREVLKKLLALPEAQKSLYYLHHGFGTATEKAVLLEAETLVNQRKETPNV